MAYRPTIAGLEGLLAMVEDDEGEAFVHQSTAEALERHNLAVLVGRTRGIRCLCRITAAGRAAAAKLAPEVGDP